MNSPPIHSSIDVTATTNVQPVVTSRRKKDAVREEPVKIDQLNLFQWLSRVCSECESFEQLLRACAEVICCHAECLGLWLLQKGEQQSFDQVFPILNDPGTLSWDKVSEQSLQMVKIATGSRHVQSASLSRNSSHQLIVVPVVEDQKTNAMVVGCFHRPKLAQQQNEMLLGIFSQSISSWLDRKKLDRAETRSRSLNDVVALGRELDRADGIKSASLILVNQVKRLTQAELVAYATLDRNKLPKVLAISDVEAIDQNYEGLKLIAGACGQSLQLQEMVVFPDRRQTGHRSDALPLEQYCKSAGFNACLSIPVVTGNGEMLGSFLLAVTPKQAAEEGYTNYLSQLTQMLSGHLDVVLKANQSLKQHAIIAAGRKLKGRFAKITAAIAVGLCAIMLIPWPYRIACECEVQPVLRRFIAAPHDGVLQRNLVENGDLVRAGQIIANLDDRQLQLELVGLEAELKGTSKKRSAAMASGAIADAQISLSQVKKLKSEIELIKDKLKNLDVRSPIDGIIVAGDLEKVEGAPVAMGQTMFEVGPLEKMLAEIAIPEQEISHVEPGMEIAIKLNAYPFETWSGKVSRIHPKSELRDQESVFIAEVELANDGLRLKPGMKGKAKVRSNAYPIGWNLFHRPLEQLRYWTIW